MPHREALTIKSGQLSLLGSDTLKVSACAVPGLETTDLSTGDVVQITGNNKVGKASITSSSPVVGVYDGTTGSVVRAGVVSASFESVSGLAAGQIVYLSSTDGKLTNTKPATGYVHEVGILVDPTTYSVLLQPKKQEQSSFEVRPDGMTFATTTLSGDQTITSTTPAPIPNIPLKLTFDANAGESVLVSYCVAAGNWETGGSVSAYVRAYLDGSPVGAVQTVRLNSSGTASASLGEGVVVSVTTSGSHTVEIYAWRTNEGQYRAYGGASSHLTVARIRGGYVIAENLPMLTYTSSSTVTLTPCPGAANQLRATLSDGSRYVSNSSLAVNLSANGRGGLDTGTKQANTWYYVYLVPALTSGQLSAVASATAPGSGGPTGFPVWKYVGAVRTDSSANLYKFYQSGATFRWAAYQWVEGPTGDPSPIDSTPVSVNLSAFCPVTASSGLFQLKGVNSGSYSQVEFWVDGDQGSATPYVVHYFVASENNDTFEIPTPTTPKVFWRKRSNVGSMLRYYGIKSMGWVDGYLVGVTQNQEQKPVVSPGHVVARQGYITYYNQTKSGGSWYDLDRNNGNSMPFSIQFSCTPNDLVVITFTGTFYSLNASRDVLFRIIVDDDPSKVYTQRQYLPSNQSEVITLPYVVSGLTAGTHTAKVQWNPDATTTLIGVYIAGSADADFSVVIPRGALTTENVPKLSYSSADVVDLVSETADSQLRCILSDGIQYTGGPTISVDLRLSGRGGLDTGTEQANTWYYLYLVPATVVGQLSAVASATPPGSGGPTGFPVWKYVGAVRNDASSNIVKFYQTGKTFYYESYRQPSAFPNGTSGLIDPKTEYSADDVWPLTAATGLGSAMAQHSNGSNNLEFGFYAVGASSPLYRGYTTSVANHYFAFSFALPVPGTTTKKFGARIWSPTGGGTCGDKRIEATGWIDGYIK